MALECPKCQFDNPEDTTFCGKCGAKFEPSEDISVSRTETLETPKEELTRGITFALLGKRENALQILGKLKARSKEMYVASSLIARIPFALGENDQGFERLAKAYEERDPFVKRIGTDPIYDIARSDPRFKALLKKMNLE